MLHQAMPFRTPIAQLRTPEPFIPNCYNTKHARGLTRASAVTVTVDGCTAPLEKYIKVVGCGSCGVDYLASIAEFPKPDQKLRTDALEVQGGGNCANALTAAARLGLKPTLVTKIGDDGIGDGIISELQGDGVDTSMVLRAAGHPSPFTYIIVDRKGGTRTCIHTPGAALQPEELTPELISRALEGAALVYFDGRLTEAAVLLAAAARAAGVPVLVEGERLRPGLQQLLELADYVVTSAHFPQEWTGAACIGDAMLEVTARLPRARMLITTQGAKGSICLVRQQQQQQLAEERCLQDVIDELSSLVNTTEASICSNSNNGADSSAACISSSGVVVQPARVEATKSAVRPTYSSSRNPVAAAEAVQQAAKQAAALNADGGNAHCYAMQTQVDDLCHAEPLTADVYVCSAAGLPVGAVADTTGAGDSFIGSVMYGITTGMQPQQILMLGAVVAACKCTALGARPGLPTRRQLAPQLLGACS